MSVSRHCRLEESITSSTSFSLSLFVCKQSIAGDAFVVSKSLRLDPSTFFDWSFIEHGKDSFSFGEKSVGLILVRVDFSTWKSLYGTFGTYNFYATYSFITCSWSMGTY